MYIYMCTTIVYWWTSDTLIVLKCQKFDILSIITKIPYIVHCAYGLSCLCLKLNLLLVEAYSFNP
jgi:hypothetical protein